MSVVLLYRAVSSSLLWLNLTVVSKTLMEDILNLCVNLVVW